MTSDSRKPEENETTIRPGAQIGTYRIESEIGAGGMGVVYKGLDTKLNRPVAVKVLSNRVADKVSRTRFQREAQMASSLNHPHIVTVYDADEFEGQQYLVTEFVDGGTLASWVKQVRPWRQTVDLLGGVGDALAAAHAANILHRDIKPGNILLSKSGYAKLADFGLAKLTDSSAVSSEETITAGYTGTIPGAVLGTPAYMSPEQAQGNPMDSRSDIFSFGAMFYELLTGTRPFAGKNNLDLLNAIVYSPAAPLPIEIPLAVRIIVEKALEKDPADRYQTAREMVVDLRRVVRSSSATSMEVAVQAPAPVRKKQLGVFTIVAGIVIAAAIGALGTRFFWREPAAAVWQGVRLGGTEIAMNPRLSPDGHTLAYVATIGGIGGPEQIAVMRPETGNQAVLTHKDGEIAWLSWSPDGTRIYFDRRGGGIYTVPALGGDEQLLLEGSQTPEALNDGTLLVFRLNGGQMPQLSRFWPDSGRLQPFPVIAAGPMTVRAFPGGREAVVLGRSIEKGGESTSHLYIVNVESGNIRRLPSGLPDDSTLSPTLAVMSDGQSVIAETFAGDGVRFLSIPANGRGPTRTLFTATSQAWFLDTGPDGGIYLDQIDRPIHVLRFPAEGGHAEVVGAIATSGVAGFFNDVHTFAVLPDGRLVVPESLGGRERLALIAEGKDPVPLVNTTEESGNPVAPAGPGEVVFMLGSMPHRTIAKVSVANGRITQRIAFDKGQVNGLAASPDGKTIYCVADGVIWAIPGEGGEPKKIRNGLSVSVSPDGRSLVVGEVMGTSVRLVRVPLDGTPEREITYSGDHHPGLQVNPNAMGKEGRILLPLETSTWYVPPGLLDPATNRLSLIKTDYVTDIHSIGWAPDGRVLALGFDLRSTMWKFRPSGQ
jgi:eukaryotic-like serine/threonine-protein kinase